MKGVLRNICYDDRNLLAIGLAFISNLIFLNTTEKSYINNFYELLSLEIKEALKAGGIIFITFIAIILLVIALIISINIILYSNEIFNKFVSVGTIIVVFIIAFYGLSYNIQGFKILFLTLFFIALFFKVWEDSKNKN
ncbi:zinc ABC transporter ATPase [Clostridium sp. LIBA-8841]|uniref:zinc ABC transporter ATPase n=1 Tax=Clostridium sp. LIBA-8841 TaxID=2987530 RepID=UPI002AC7CADB|nr:zinc ABC transporter ATPase [Clostridium sp. LIBA-8841]MDZ5252436.1 zinc ABC transporter ATPase [Clostridium sp. LIBA-8841]